MDKIEALNSFVKQNLSALTSTSATQSIVKNLKAHYYNKLGQNIYFKNKEIAESVILSIIKIKKDDPDKITQEIMKIPFISAELSQDKVKEIILENSLEETASILTKADLSKLQHEDYLKKLEQQFEDNARTRVENEISDQKQRLEELIAEVEKDREELKKYKSELDELPLEIFFNQDDLKIKNKNEFSETSWWRQIGLTGNPFPSDEGLIGIPKEMYDKIVVRTKFFTSYLSKIENNPEDFLGNSIVIAGEFGSGKTTLLNMIRYKLASQGILPCSIVLIPKPDADAMINELLIQLGIQLNKNIFNLTGNQHKDEIVVDNLSKLSLVLEDFKKYDGKGLIISIDGLHKGTKYFPQTIEFLQQLQNVHEFIEQQEVKCGFILAGSLFWEKEIIGGPSLSGSISKIDRMPPLTEEDAVEAVIRRIQSYAPSDKSAPTIKRNSIRLAFRTYQQRLGKPITFRSFMNHIRDRLVIGRYDEVGIEVSSHFEIVDTVKNYLRSSSISSNYIAIEREIQKNPQLREILSEVLVKIYQWRGVEESNKLFKDYIKVFQLLRIQGFIVQRKSIHGGLFVWSISPSLAKTFTKIQEKYAIPASDSISCLFESRKNVIKREKETLYSDLIFKINQTSTSLRDSWPKINRLLQETKQILKQIEEQIINENIGQINFSILSESCKQFVACILEAGGISENTTLENSWISPDNIEEINDFCTKSFDQLKTESEVFGLLHHHVGILEQLLDMLLQLTQGEGITRLSNRRILNKDFQDIHKARILFLNQSYRDCVDVTGELLEGKARDIGFTVSKIIFGDNLKDVIPKDILDKIPIETRGHPRTKRTSDINLFYDISRSEYSKILFQKSVRKILFGNTIRDTEFEQMKDIWDLAFSLGDRGAHRDRPTYFREHATEIADVLRLLPSICEKFVVASESILFLEKFTYEKNVSSISGYFLVDTQLKTRKIIIENKEAQRIMKVILTSIYRNPREALPFNNILIVEGVDIEKQVAMINAMIQSGLLIISDVLSLSITDKGMASLKQLIPDMFSNN